MKQDIDKVIKELETNGVTRTSYIGGYLHTEQGLGDLVENVLGKFGITESRFKQWFNLKECDCSKRKKWLNELFTQYKNKRL